MMKGPSAEDRTWPMFLSGSKPEASVAPLEVEGLLVVSYFFSSCATLNPCPSTSREYLFQGPQHHSPAAWEWLDSFPKMFLLFRNRVYKWGYFGTANGASMASLLRENKHWFRIKRLATLVL